MPLDARSRHFWPWIGAGLLYLALTVVICHPLVFLTATRTTTPSDDPLFTTWVLWWSTQALPLTDAWWNAPLFYPTAGAMAFSEVLLGLLPITAPIQWLTGNPVVAFNVSVLLSFPLSALAAHALAYELTGRHDAALLAGLAYGFSPFRANEIGHVQMLSYYWAPVALLALHRYVRTHRMRWLALCAAALLMQVLCNGYSLFQLPVLIGLWMIWFSAKPRDFVAAGAAVICGVLPLVPMLLRYQEIQQTYHMRRSIGDILGFSADIASLVTAPAQALLLGNVLTARPGYALFPGLTILLILGAALVMHLRRRPSVPATLGIGRILLASLAIVAAAAAASVFVFGPWQAGPLSVSRAHKPMSLAVFAMLACFALGPRWRATWRSRSAIAFYIAGAIVCYVLAFGPEPRLLGQPVMYKAPYSWLMALPGFNAVRAPDRFAVLATLCLAIAGSLAYARWLSPPGGRRRFLWMALAIGLCVDGAFRMSVRPLPKPGPTEWADARAVLELPIARGNDVPAMYRAIAHGLPVVNAASGYVAPPYSALMRIDVTGEIAVIAELAPYGPIGIAIDRASPHHARLEAAVAGLAGVTRLAETPAWTQFRLAQAPAVPTIVGPAAGIRQVTSNRHVEEIRLMRDGRTDTAWESGTQSGGEELIVELEANERVGAIVMKLGICSFGFPRELVVETSTDGLQWTDGWRGSTTQLTLRAALADSTQIPLTIAIPPVTARFVRLRQVGTYLESPWCFAELSVHR